MLEVERKILGINKARLISKIKKLSPKPKKVFEGRIRVRYFDFLDARIKTKKDLLRVREFLEKDKNPKTELVYKIYKGIKNNNKIFEEIEVEIPGAHHDETLTKIFEAMGLKQTVMYEKKRTLYKWGSVSFEIDEHPQIPAFLEIEGTPSGIEKAIKKLGLENNEQTAESIGELMQRKYPKISLNGLRFR